MIRKFTLFIFCVFISIQVNAQQYEISISPGLFTSADWGMYQGVQPGIGAMVLFNYQVNPKWSVFSHYHFGRFYERGTNIRLPVDAEYLSFGVARHFQINPSTRLGIGTGIGLIYETSDSYDVIYDEISRKNEIVEGKRSVRDFSMPLLFTLKKDINERFFYGLTTGFYVTPFYIFGGYHLAPTIGIKL
jgi:hypothetical protein